VKTQSSSNNLVLVIDTSHFFFLFVVVLCRSQYLIYLAPEYCDRLIAREVNVLVKKEMDALVAASNVYKLLNENDKVRVLEVVSRPGDVAKMHHHPDHVVYAL